ncbi:MAG: CaiB/BaiF CoA transferase family protein [Pseudohongiellaceae bacterium]|jgi:crotonobetainyl-CoA:carnitine CoA-transferase CaiB-like acyl-CoA transferase
MTELPAQPLSGITVLSFEHAIAAPLCTRQLADLGARVIKIERRNDGDFARHYDDRVRGLSSHFVWTNRGKESLTLDIKHADAQPVMRRLLAASDVLVQNLSPGALARLGLDHATLQETFPELVVCNITGYGHTGPYAGRKAYDLLIQAEAGLLSVTGNQDNLAKAGISIADIAAGSQAHSAILAALLARTQSGQGQEINITMLDAMVEWMGFPLYYSLDGQQPPPRSGADHASIYPYGVFQCAGGEPLMLGLQNEREWREFCTRVLEQPELAADPRFSNNARRSANRDALRPLIETCFNCQQRDTVSARLDAAGIAWANVNDLHAVWQHPQLQQQQRFATVDTPAGPVPGLRPPADPGTNENLGRVPKLGEHTSKILKELGFSDTDIEHLHHNAVI